MNEVLWFLSRASGVVSMALITVVLVLGMLTSGRRRPSGDSATIVMGLHRWLSLGMVAFLTAHVATAVAETYVPIDAISAVVPFTAGYETLWVGLGTLGVDLLLAVTVTSLLRHRLSPRLWKAVHGLSYALWPTAIAHGFMLGTSDEPLLRGITVLCALAGVTAVAWRLNATHADRERRLHVISQEWS